MTALLELNRRLGLPAFPRYPRDREWGDLTTSWDDLFVRVKDAVAELRQCPVHTIRAQRQEWHEVVSRWRECHLLAPEAVVDENRKPRAFEERRRHLAECEALERILRC